MSTNVPGLNCPMWATMDHRMNLPPHNWRAQVALSACHADSWIMCPTGTCPWLMCHLVHPLLWSAMIAAQRRWSTRHQLQINDRTCSKL